MRRLLAAVMCATSLACTAVGQTGTNFGSRTGGLGNAGGFATGSGLSNGSAVSLYFNQSAGFAFGNTPGFSNGGNAVFPYGGNAVYSNGAGAFPVGNLYSGGSNVGALNAAGPALPGLGLGAGINGLGIAGFEGLTSSGLGLGGTGLYGDGLGLGGLPAPGLDSTSMGFGVPGLNYGVPGLNYGMPGSGYAMPNPTFPGAATGPATNRSRRENFTNNARQNGTDAMRAAVPIVTGDAVRIQERMARSGSRTNFRNIKVLMAGRTVVLQGRVDSPADDQLAQRLVSLEPGVDRVVSQLDYPGKAQANALTPR